MLLCSRRGAPSPRRRPHARVCGWRAQVAAAHPMDERGERSGGRVASVLSESCSPGQRVKRITSCLSGLPRLKHTSDVGGYGWPVAISVIIESLSVRALRACDAELTERLISSAGEEMEPSILRSDATARRCALSAARLAPTVPGT